MPPPQSVPHTDKMHPIKRKAIAVAAVTERTPLREVASKYGVSEHIVRNCVMAEYGKSVARARHDHDAREISR